MSKKPQKLAFFNENVLISSKIFNHKQFVESLDINAFIQNEAIMPCNCEDSPYKDSEHGHIVTGDLRIVRNNKRRKLITKGPKYREPSSISWNKAKLSIKDG